MEFTSEFARQVLVPFIVGVAVFMVQQFVPKLKAKSIATRLGVAFLVFVLAAAATYVTLKKGTNEDLTIAGAIIDESDHSGISGAEISIVGRTETCTSEDNGNFKLKLGANGESPDQVRLRVQKVGYLPKEESVTPPTHGVELQLRKRRE